MKKNHRRAFAGAQGEQIASPPQERAFLFFQNCPRGEGNCAAVERQKLSRGNFCVAASRCLSRPSGLANGHFAWVTPAIFVVFVDFRGLRSKTPFSVGSMNALSEFSPIFVKTTRFQQGTKNTVFQNDNFDNPDSVKNRSWGVPTK